MAPLKSLKKGRFTDFKKIGGGGRGKVYKATDTSLDRPVAIKVLDKEAISEESYSRFLNEARVIARFGNEHIVKIFEIGKEAGVQFFVLEFIDGTNLLRRMQASPEGRCDVSTVLSIGKDICKALQYAHSQDVLHRDIKPENIMVTDDGVAKLTDFGLAEILGQTGIKEKRVIKGTEAYIAPEATRGKAEKRSDLYSLGAVLYEAVTGRPPFGKPAPDNEEEKIRVISSHILDVPVSPTELNSKVPKALAECIMKLLEKEPERRFGSAEDLLRKLSEISQEESLGRIPEQPLEPSIVVPDFHSIHRNEVGLVDRVEELNLLKEVVNRTAAGEGGFLFLHGEYGIGKTRLAREVEAYAQSRGVQTLHADCARTHPYLISTDNVPPYILWRQVIKYYLEEHTRHQLSWIIPVCRGEIFELVPELGPKLGVVPPFSASKPEEGQYRLFDAVTQLITEISRMTPLLIVLDDLQWADKSSLQLMHYLAQDTKNKPLLLLGDYRDTDINATHPLFPVVSELDRERLAQSINLKRMNREDTSNMIRLILHQNEVPDRFLDSVYEKTGGNPLFVEKTIEYMKNEKTIIREGGKWKIREVTRVKFPEIVRAIIRTRIDRLDKESQTALSMASFFGSDFTLEALLRVTGFGEEKIDRILGKILKAELLKEKDTVPRRETYAFVDNVTRDFVHEEIMHFKPSKHRKLHGLVGNVLEEIYTRDKDDEHSADLAGHYQESGETNKALEYFMKAGERASRLYANDEAVTYFQSALELLNNASEGLSKKGRILERLGDVQKTAGRPDVCIKYWNKALSLWHRLHENENAARLHRKAASVLWERIGDVEGAEKHHKKCLAILRKSPESDETARLYEDKAHMYWRNGKLGKARTCAEKSLLLARKLNNREVEVDSCVDLAAISGLTGDSKRVREYSNRALRMAQSIQALGGSYLETAARAYLEVAQWLPFEDYEKRLGCLENGLELAMTMGDIGKKSKFWASLAGEYVVRGELNKAKSFGEAALSLDKKVGNKTYIPGDLQIIGFVYQISGDLEKAKKFYDEAAKISQDMKDVRLIASSAFHLGMLFFDRKEYAKARKSFERALRSYEKAGESRPQVSQFLILTLIELDEIEKASGLLLGLQKLAAKTTDALLSVHANMLRAILLRAQRKWKEAIELFSENMREWEALQEPIWNRYYFARVLLCECARAHLDRAHALNLDSDKEKADELLNQALDVFQEIGARRDVMEIMAKKERRAA